MERITYELKYCERCGSLCTRRRDSSDTYCDACAQMLTPVCLPSGAGRRPRGRRNRTFGLVPQKSVPPLKSEAAGGRLQ